MHHPTNKELKALLPGFLAMIERRYGEKGERVVAAWPTIVGSPYASMSQALTFVDGVLTVKVKNATAYSLLASQEKPRLLRELRAAFPQVTIRNIILRM